MAAPSAPDPRTQPTYELLYHPQIPGRGEFLRLLLEATHTPYLDLANERNDGYAEVQRLCISATATESAAGNPPVFAPPGLRVRGGKRDGGDLVVWQTATCLAYLAGRLGTMEGEGEERWWVQALAMTALDANNEVHDTHHPVGPSLYYEDQKAEAKRKAADFRASRLPKFLGYFARVLEGNAAKGLGRYLVGGRLTYADTTVWQVLDGLFFAFPREMEARKGEFGGLLGTFYEGVQGEEGVKEYLASERRKGYSMGVFRHYPELDRQ